MSEGMTLRERYLLEAAVSEDTAWESVRPWLAARTPPPEQVEFFRGLLRKPFVRTLREICADHPHVTEFEMAKALSSYPTHVLIEMELQVGRQGLIYESFGLAEAVDVLALYLTGSLSAFDVRDYIQLTFGPCFAQLTESVGGSQDQHRPGTHAHAGTI